MWKRLQNRLLRRDEEHGVRFFIHKNYRIASPLREYDSRRPFRILRYLESQDLLRRGMLRRPRPASLRQIKLVHTDTYLSSLADPQALVPILGSALPVPDHDRFLSFQRLMCGGTLAATHFATSTGGIGVNLGGGLHHAYRDRGHGLCVFNDVAVAIACHRHNGAGQRILVVDLDLHDGDGTRSIFAADPTVHTFSLHNRHLGPTEAVAATSLALGSEVGDAAFLEILQQQLPPLLGEFRPDLVFYLAGSDSSIDDRLGDWRLTLEGMLTRDRCVLDFVRTAGIPTVILLAGGYGSRAWRHGAAFFSWLLCGDSDLDIPLEMDLPVGHYRRLTRLMRTRDLLPEESSAGGPDDWGLTPTDLGPGGASANPLFLGQFSDHALEVALEQYGLLDRLRRMGFSGLQVILDQNDPLGHTIRITTSGAEPLVLVEIKLRVDRSHGPDWAFLAIEWLLLQDSRHQFELSRPLLPGQEYPGLGLLQDTAAVLVVVCEKLDLDGLLFTPSHYHLAHLSRPQAFSMDPDQEGDFRALQNAMKHQRLAEASRCLASGRLRNRETGERVTWTPTPVVIPVSARLRRHFASSAYQDRLKACRPDWECLEEYPDDTKTS